MNSVKVRLLATCKQRFFTTMKVNKLFVADFVLRGVALFFSNVCRSSTGIRQDSVQLLPLSAGQFFWSVVSV